MELKKVWLAIGMLIMTMGAVAQNNFRYRVKLTDKKATEYSLAHPKKYLSKRAVERRKKQGLAIDSTDLPVCSAYIKMLEEQGGRCVHTSKWNNTVIMETSSEAVAEAYRKQPFVESVRKVWIEIKLPVQKKENRKEEVTNRNKKQKDRFGLSKAQIALHRGDSLHQMGYRGRGIHIAVIDAGFYNVDAMNMFKRARILGTHDFVNPQSDIYGEHNHGLKVLSCMAANIPHTLVGTAPEASYWLLRSEDNDTEQIIEEDNWAAAVEFADSVGVDVINTSLGYYSYDNADDNYQYRELDGHTSLMSNTASYIAKKGMVLVCSAGNTGLSTWKKITPPADGEDILTVGAIDLDGLNTDFSAIGYTADGRVKPDVMSAGFKVSVAGNNGGTSYANGTSFSAPILCGLVACLWQACPWMNALDIIDVVRRSGDRYDVPDNIYGYGIADMYKAYQLALQKKH